MLKVQPFAQNCDNSSTDPILASETFSIYHPVLSFTNCHAEHTRRWLAVDAFFIAGILRYLYIRE